MQRPLSFLHLRRKIRAVQIFNPNPNNTVYTYPVTFSVKKPDGWGVIYYDSGIFPAGTVFIAPNNFTKYPSVWGFNDQTDSATGVSITDMPVSTYNQPWARGTMGPVQFFTSKYSDTYRVRLIDHGSALCIPYKIKSKHKKVGTDYAPFQLFLQKNRHMRCHFSSFV